MAGDVVPSRSMDSNMTTWYDWSKFGTGRASYGRRCVVSRCETTGVVGTVSAVKVEWRARARVCVCVFVCLCVSVCY